MLHLKTLRLDFEWMNTLLHEGHMCNGKHYSIWYNELQKLTENNMICKVGQTKDYKIGICCFFAKHAALRSKNKDWLSWNQHKLSEWGDMSIRWLLFQWASTIKIQLSMFSWYKADIIIIILILACSHNDIAENSSIDI